MQTSPPEVPQGADLGGLAASPIPWILAGLLLLAAVYFIIRLLELDLVNEKTPHQEEPLPH